MKKRLSSILRSMVIGGLVATGVARVLIPVYRQPGARSGQRAHRALAVRAGNLQQLGLHHAMAKPGCLPCSLAVTLVCVRRMARYRLDGAQGGRIEAGCGIRRTAIPGRRIFDRQGR